MGVTLAVGLGGALGSVARFWIGLAVATALGTAFPWGTLVINVLGSFVIGAAAALPGSDTWRAFLMAGVCGGFTTFSAFSLQTLALLRAGQAGAAACNVAASVGACVLAAAAGMSLGQRLAATMR